jgi:hypothetical protein
MLTMPTWLILFYPSVYNRWITATFPPGQRPSLRAWLTEHYPHILNEYIQYLPSQEK